MAKNDKRNWLLMLPIVGVGIGYLILLGYFLWVGVLDRSAAGSSPPPVPTRRALIDLWDAYGQARTVAQMQTEDAQLVSASTQWQAASEEALLDGSRNWSFVFYSPANGSSLDVVVSAGTARVVDETRVWVTPGMMADGAWQEGPRDALLMFLAHGGRAFLDEHPQAAVDLHLAEDDEGRAAWIIVALDAEARSLLSLSVDVESGQVSPG